MGSIEEQVTESEAELEKLATQAEAEDREPEESEQGGELVVEDGRNKAMAFIGALHSMAKLAEPRIEWSQQVYQEGGDKLGPIFDKYQLSDSLAGRYVEEINAGFFVAGLIVGTAKQVRDLKIEDAKKKKKSEPDQEPESTESETESKPDKRLPPLIVG